MRVEFQWQPIRLPSAFLSGPRSSDALHSIFNSPLAPQIVANLHKMCFASALLALLPLPTVSKGGAAIEHQRATVLFLGDCSSPVPGSPEYQGTTQSHPLMMPSKLPLQLPTMFWDGSTLTTAPHLSTQDSWFRSTITMADFSPLEHWVINWENISVIPINT